MGKKILKITLGIILSVAGLLLVIGIAIYIPAVQRFIKDKALGSVSASTGMRITIDGFRMGFPAVLRLDNVTVAGVEGDTLLTAGSAGVRVALLPLLRSEVRARGLELNRTRLDYADSAGSIRIEGTLASLTIPMATLDLRRSDVDITGIDLQGADITMVLGDSAPDTESPDTSRWKIAVRTATLSDIDFKMSGTAGQLDARIRSGRIEGARVSVPDQTVDARSVTIDTIRAAYSPPPERIAADTTANLPTDSPPWTVRVGSVEVSGGDLQYYTVEPRDNTTGRFDAANIRATRLRLGADSILSRGSDIALRLRTLSLRESSGVVIEDAQGSFAMDSAGIRLLDFNLDTSNSHIGAELRAGDGLLTADPATGVDLDLNADILASELFAFIPPTPQLRTALTGRRVTVKGSVSGTLGSLDISQLRARIPGAVDLTLDGTLSSVTDPSRLGGDLTFNGQAHDPSFIKGFIPDSALRARIDIPPGVRLAGRAEFSPGYYAPDITIRADSGSLELAGTLDTRTEAYKAEIRTIDFPLYKFLPRDSLGIATLALDASGSGFDPLSAAAAADISLVIDRFDYYNYPYSDLTLKALLSGGQLRGHLHSGSAALAAELDLAGSVADSAYRAMVWGRIGRADIGALGFSRQPLAVAGILDASLAVYPDTAYVASLVLDTVRVDHGQGISTIAHAEAGARAGQNGVEASARSGDLDMEFTARVPFDSIGRRIEAASYELEKQIEARSLDMEALQQTLPPLELDLTAGRDNILHSFLTDNGYGFNNLNVSVSTLDNEPLRAALVAKGLTTSGVTLDTLNVWLRRSDQRLEYALRLRNRPGNIEQMAMVRARGYVEENTAQLGLLQRNRRDSVGFRFVVQAQLLDSAVTVTMLPDNLVFGYRPWSVNPGNYFTYDFDRELYADMRLDGDGEHVYIVSAPFEGFPQGAVNVDMGGIDIATALELFPSPPPAAGTLSADVLFGMTGERFAVEGEVGVDSARWDGRRIGNIDIRADIRSDSSRTAMNGVTMSVDGTRVLAAEGTLGSGRTDVDATITSLPMTAVNPFLPEDVLQAEGAAAGRINLVSEGNDLSVDGYLAFDGAALTVPFVGTRYTLPADRILFEGGGMVFDRYAITDPNGQPLEIDGTLDISDLSSPAADLTLTAENFQAVNSQRSGGSDVYGRALTDIDISATGAFSALRVRGDISLLTGTDVTYTLPDNNLEIQDRSQDIVTFISFADTAVLFAPDSAALVQVWGVDMLVNVDIEDNVKATINLSDDGNNRAELIGDGALTFTMNSQGDSRFTGRYTLSGGTVVYNPPVISAKSFTVNDGSYVEWTGDVANPTFNVTATESLRTTVTSDGSSRNVNFDVTVSIRGSLDELALVFDLAAPGDLAIQNQLQSLSPDQRSQQAIALLVYNTYTGPGTTAKVDTNNPLNSFIEKELNQWARNSLPGVDLSIGVTSVDDAGGGQHTDYSYRVSKSLFDDRVQVTVGGSINPEASTNDNLKDNFVDDISLEYRLSDRDNMFLKAYRYNTRESILEGEVVETGFGFVARKKLNKLKELFRLRRTPEQKAVRRTKRELKQQIRQEERSSGVDPAREQRQDDPLTLNNDNEEASATRQQNPGMKGQDEAEANK